MIQIQILTRLMYIYKTLVVSKLETGWEIHEFQKLHLIFEIMRFLKAMTVSVERQQWRLFNGIVTRGLSGLYLADWIY